MIPQIYCTFFLILTMVARFATAMKQGVNDQLDAVKFLTFVIGILLDTIFLSMLWFGGFYS